MDIPKLLYEIINTHSVSRGRLARTSMVPVNWLFCRYLRKRKQVNLEQNQYHATIDKNEEKNRLDIYMVFMLESELKV